MDKTPPALDPGHRLRFTLLRILVTASPSRQLDAEMELGTKEKSVMMEIPLTEMVAMPLVPSNADSTVRSTVHPSAETVTKLLDTKLATELRDALNTADLFQSMSATRPRTDAGTSAETELLKRVKSVTEDTTSMDTPLTQPAQKTAQFSQTGPVMATSVPRNVQMRNNHGSNLDN